MIFRKHIEQLPQQLTDCNSSSRAPSLQAFQPTLDIIPTPSAAESTTHKANPRWDEASLAEEKANALHPSMNSDKIPQIQHKSDLHINAKEKCSNPQATSQNPPPKSPSIRKKDEANFIWREKSGERRYLRTLAMANDERATDWWRQGDARFTKHHIHN